jgi:hypothetical protein
LVRKLFRLLLLVILWLNSGCDSGRTSGTGAAGTVGRREALP